MTNMSVKSSLETENMTWEQFDYACRQIAEKLQGIRFSGIYGIPRNGLVVAIRLSYLMNLPLILSETDIRFFTLVVDDIVDSGQTLQKLRDRLFGMNFITASLYIHSNSNIKPSVSVYTKTDKWIVFPWEKK